MIFFNKNYLWLRGDNSSGKRASGYLKSLYKKSKVRLKTT